MTCFDPDWVVHPGELLREELQTRGMTETELALLTGVTLKHVSTVVNGHKPITPWYAVRLERVLGISARLWARMQADYDVGLLQGKMPL